MAANEFGLRLRELRQRAGLSQRELAEKVGVNFTYLSKIESGAMPPPSQKIILKLAEVLNVDQDELTILAGKIPADIAEILKDREILERLRARLATKETAMQRLNPPGNLPKGTRAPLKLARVAIAAILVVLIAMLLWFLAPNKDTAVAANNRAVVYNKSGEYLKAIEASNQAIKLDPSLAVAYNNRAWSYLELGQYEQAITDSSKAIDLDPRLALAYSNRGLAYIRLGHYEQAVADCTKAIDLDPRLALAYANRGTAYIQLGRYDKAIADLHKAVQLDPSLQK